LTDSSGKYAVETCSCGLLLTDFDSNYAEEVAKEVTQMALCSFLLPCDHFWPAAVTRH